MQCYYCGTALPPEANYCSNCGQPVGKAATGPTTRLENIDGSYCPKCAGLMERGYIPDHGREDRIIIWVQGQPKSDWMGSLSYRRQRVWRVETLCCSQCGYLESYATTEIARSEG